MKPLDVLMFFMISYMLVATSCSHITPEQITGTWKIDKIIVDGIDKTTSYHGMPFGNGIEFNQDGTFKTNHPDANTNAGLWKMNQNGSKIALYINGTDYSNTSWKITAGQQYLSLKATTMQLQLSRAINLPEPPPPVFSMKNNLPGTWLFYQLKTGDNVSRYLQNKHNPKWIKIFRNMQYESGEGDIVFFRGTWLLENDTIFLSDILNNKEFQWKIRFNENQLVFGGPLTDSTEWQEVSFVNENRITF